MATQLDITMREQLLCLECQKCCKVIVFPTNYKDEPDVRHFYETRGMKVRWDDRWGLLIMVDHQCPHLTERGCNIYSKRPDVCRRYDGRKDPFMADECAWKELGKKSAVFDMDKRRKRDV